MSPWEPLSWFLGFHSMSFRLTLAFTLSLSLVSRSPHAAPVVTEDSICAVLVAHAVPLHQAGEAQLLAQARGHDFFLLGELHGENGIPELIRELWPQLWTAGYRHNVANRKDLRLGDELEVGEGAQTTAADLTVACKQGFSEAQ